MVFGACRVSCLGNFFSIKCVFRTVINDRLEE